MQLGNKLQALQPACAVHEELLGGPGVAACIV